VKLVRREDHHLALTADSPLNDETPPTMACESYSIDMTAAAFGQCKCGRPKAEHTRTPGRAAPRTPNKTVSAFVPTAGGGGNDAGEGGASVCSNYRVNMAAAAFGECKCGHPKAAHAATTGAAMSKAAMAKKAEAERAAAESAKAEAAAAEAKKAAEAAEAEAAAKKDADEAANAAAAEAEAAAAKEAAEAAAAADAKAKADEEAAAAKAAASKVSTRTCKLTRLGLIFLSRNDHIFGMITFSNARKRLRLPLLPGHRRRPRPPRHGPTRRRRPPRRPRRRRPPSKRRRKRQQRRRRQLPQRERPRCEHPSIRPHSAPSAPAFKRLCYRGSHAYSLKKRKVGIHTGIIGVLME